MECSVKSCFNLTSQKSSKNSFSVLLYLIFCSCQLLLKVAYVFLNGVPSRRKRVYTLTMRTGFVLLSFDLSGLCIFLIGICIVYAKIKRIYGS